MRWQVSVEMCILQGKMGLGLWRVYPALFLSFRPLMFLGVRVFLWLLTSRRVCGQAKE